MSTSQAGRAALEAYTSHTKEYAIVVRTEEL